LTTVLKLGGELLEDSAALKDAASRIVRFASHDAVAVVHGGGRAIDAELRNRGLTPRFADGLRVTDEQALDAVITVLAGRTNTQLVAAVNGAGNKAVGLTGADGQLGRCVRSAPVRTQSGEIVDLGLVGEPASCNAEVVLDLLRLGYIPVIASIGITSDGVLLNINADTFAAHLAVELHADRLLIAGTTPGVLDAAGRTVPEMHDEDIDAMTAAGTAHSGMIAKLNACRYAATRGVRDVSIVSGGRGVDFDAAVGTRITASPLSVAGLTEPEYTD
jgi:acetylglutamate kinase